MPFQVIVLFFHSKYFSLLVQILIRGSTPLEIAAEAFAEGYRIKSTDCIATFRFLADDLDFSEKDADGWSFVKTLVMEQWRFGDVMRPNHDSERSALMSCALQIVASEMHDHYLETSAAELLFSVDSILCREVFDTLLGVFDNCIDARERPNGYSILLRKFDESGDHQDLCEDLQMILEKGADPHLVGSDDEWSPREETPTSLAMYSSWLFAAWQEALWQTSMDLENFVKKELQQSPLKETGWDEDLLLALFLVQVPPYPRPPWHCDLCETDKHVLVHVPWHCMLERLRQVKYPENDFNLNIARLSIAHRTAVTPKIDTQIIELIQAPRAYGLIKKKKIISTMKSY